MKAIIHSAAPSIRAIHLSLHPSATDWHGRRDLNPQPTVLETATLPIELLPYPPNLACLLDNKGAAGFIPALLNLKTV